MVRSMGKRQNDNLQLKQDQSQRLFKPSNTAQGESHARISPPVPAASSSSSSPSSSTSNLEGRGSSADGETSGGGARGGHMHDGTTYIMDTDPTFVPKHSPPSSEGIAIRMLDVAFSLPPLQVHPSTSRPRASPSGGSESLQQKGNRTRPLPHTGRESSSRGGCGSPPSHASSHLDMERGAQPSTSPSRQRGRGPQTTPSSIVHAPGAVDWHGLGPDTWAGRLAASIDGPKEHAKGEGLGYQELHNTSTGIPRWEMVERLIKLPLKPIPIPKPIPIRPAHGGVRPPWGPQAPRVPSTLPPPRGCTDMTTDVMNRACKRHRHQPSKLRRETMPPGDALDATPQSHPVVCPSSRLCISCKVHEREMCIVPCGHLGVCADCGKNLSRSKGSRVAAQGDAVDEQTDLRLDDDKAVCPVCKEEMVSPWVMDPGIWVALGGTFQ